MLYGVDIGKSICQTGSVRFASPNRIDNFRDSRLLQIIGVCKLVNLPSLLGFSLNFHFRSFAQERGNIMDRCPTRCMSDRQV